MPDDPKFGNFLRTAVICGTNWSVRVELEAVDNDALLHAQQALCDMGGALSECPSCYANLRKIKPRV